jgi:TetR/AcrR family transcriptional regulator, cholesterol catabolism regulator
MTGSTAAGAGTGRQRTRRSAIIRTATAMLISGGDANLQMKTLAPQAGVSLATLYRYFPSKDHLLLAISLSRYEEAAVLTAAGTPSGSTPGARVEAHLLKEFSAEQRYPELTAALLRVSQNTDRSYAELIGRILDKHLEILEVVARGPDPELDHAAARLLPVVSHIFSSASRNWFAGVRSSAEVRMDISIGARLLDLPPRLIAAALLQSTAPD